MINHPNRSKVAARALAHTPGPWRYLEDHDGDAAGQPLTVCDASNNDLANIYSREDATVDISRQAAIANARLIASAPDLLAVVQRSAEGWANAIELNLIPEQHVPAATILRDEARAAITKAKGR